MTSVFHSLVIDFFPFIIQLFHYSFISFRQPHLTKEEASKETIHARYKDLALVEHAFRTMKQSHLEIRPLYLRREDRTRAHVFVTMLAYMIERKLAEYWKEAELTVKEGLDALRKSSKNVLQKKEEEKLRKERWKLCGTD